jgi:hypothetical protein
MTDFRGSMNALLFRGELLEFSPGRIGTVHTTWVAPEVIRVYNFQRRKNE